MDIVRLMLFECSTLSAGSEHLVAAACDDGSVKFFGVQNGTDITLRGSLVSDSGRALSVSWEKEGQRVATGHSDGSIRIWDLTISDDSVAGKVTAFCYTALVR